MANTVESSREAAAPRPWYRLCPATWLGLLLGTAVLVFVEVPGRRTSFTTYAHGWPLVYLQRDYLLLPPVTSPSGVLVAGAGMSYVSAGNLADWVEAQKTQKESETPDDMPWDFEQQMTPWSMAGGGELKLIACAVDILIACLMLAAAGWGVERWSRRRSSTRRLRFFQFRLRTLLIGVTLFALCFGKIGGWYNQYRDEQHYLGQFSQPTGGVQAQMAWSPPAGIPESLLKIGGAEQIFSRVQSLNWTVASDADLRQMPAMSALSELTIDGPGITATGIEQLARFPRLRQLTIDGFGIDDEALEKLNGLRSLEQLNVMRTTGHHLHVHGLENLKSFILQSDGVGVDTGTAPFPEIKSMDPRDVPKGEYWEPEIRLDDLPNLKTLSIDGGTLTDRSLHDIEDLPKLEELWLGPHIYTGPRQLTFQRGRTVHKLELNLQGVEGISVRDLAKLESLTIYTSHQLTAVSIEQLPNLNELAVSWNEQLAFVRLSQLPRLSVADLSSNPTLRFVETQQLEHIQKLLLSTQEPAPFSSTVQWQRFQHSAGIGSTRTKPLVLRGLASLSTLQSLDLSGQQLAPRELRDLTRLTELESLKLSGMWINNVQLELIRPLSKLRELDLSGTDVSAVGLESLYGMSRLATLDLEDTHVAITDDSAIRLSKSIPALTISGLEPETSGHVLENAMADPLKRELTFLVIPQSRAIVNGDLACLADREPLESLDLSGAQITDVGLRHLEKLVNLHALDLQGAHVDDAGLLLLQSLRRLQTLGLGGTRVSGAGLANLQRLPDLVALDLSDCQLTDDDLTQLEKLPNLQRLILSGTQITDAGLAHLATLKHLRALDLSLTKVTDAGLTQLQPLAELQSLDLSQTAISDAGLLHVQKLSRLETLRLSKCRVAGPGLDGLRQLANLSRLDLSGNPLRDDAIRKYLAALVHLRSLALDDVPMSEAALASLAKLANLETLSFGNSNFSKSDGTARFAALRNFPALKKLDISFATPSLDLIDEAQGSLPNVEVDWAANGGEKDAFWPSQFYEEGDPALGRITGTRPRPSDPPEASEESRPAVFRGGGVF